MEKETTFYYTFYTRLGDMTVGCTASSIVMLSLNSKIFSKSNTNLPDLAYETEKQILEYLDGKRTNFTLPLAPKGTDFQRKVWDALLTVKPDHTKRLPSPLAIPKDAEQSEWQTTEIRS